MMHASTVKSRRQHVAQRAAGFTLLELLLVAALVIILFATAIENLLPLRGDAERAAVEATTASLRSAVAMEAMRRTVSVAGLAAVEAMDGQNPFDWLATPAGNFAGAFDGTGHADVAPGSWGFDAESGTIFYRVRYPEYFDGSFLEPPGIRFRVRLSYDARGLLSAVGLEQMDAAAWNTDGSVLSRFLWSGE